MKPRQASFSIVRRITALAAVMLVSLVLQMVQPLVDEVDAAQVGQLRALRATLHATAPEDRAVLVQALAAEGISVSPQGPAGAPPVV